MMDVYSTHLPHLREFVERTDGPVIEFGTGWYSTPYLEAMSRATGRLVMSIETNRAWWWQFRELHHYQHSVVCVADYEALIPELADNWSVCLVDSSPERQRAKIVNAMRNRARYIVVHDTEPAAEIYYGIEDTLATFPCRSDRFDAGVRTTIVSMTEQT